MIKQFLSRKFLVVFAFNALLAIVASQFLGNVAGWLSPQRAGMGIALGDGIPFLQFLAFGALLETAMWALARRGPGAKAPTRVPPLALQIATFVIYVVVISAAINIVFDKSLATILGASGIIGLVLGFALRGLVSDVFSGIALQLDPTLNPGDWLDFQYR